VNIATVCEYLWRNCLWFASVLTSQVQWLHLPTLIHCYNTILRTLLPNLIWEPNLLAFEKFCTTHNRSLMRDAKKSERKSPRITIKYSACYEIHIICKVWCCENSSVLVCGTVSFGTWFPIGSRCLRLRGWAVWDVEDEGSLVLTNIRTCLVDKATSSPRIPPTLFNCTCFNNKNLIPCIWKVTMATCTQLYSSLVPDGQHNGKMC